MYSHIFQKLLEMILVMTLAIAVQPQGHKLIRYIDKKIPKYEYGYIVSDKEGNAQGHVESRDGIFALGRYYISLPNGTGQKVTYFADDLGYHPLVSYASTSSKGSSRTQFAMGERAISALSDIFSVKNNIATTNVISTTPESISSFSSAKGFISTNYTPTQQTNLYLAAPIAASKTQNFFTQSGNIILPFGSKIESSLKNTKKSDQTENKAVEYERKKLTNPQSQENEYQTTLYVSELNKIVANGLEKRLEEESIKNNSQNENLYHDNDVIKNIASGNSSIKKGSEGKIVEELNSYIELANRIKTGTDKTVTEDQRHLNALSSTQIFSTNTMKPIIVPGKLQSESQKLIFSEQLPANSIVRNINSQNRYNEVNQTSLPFLFNSFNSISLVDPTITKNSDSASQSSNSIVVNHSDAAVNEASGTAHSMNPLTALQVGTPTFSFENTKPTKEVTEENNVNYKTVVDIQEGISFDITQNPYGSFGVLSNNGQRIPSQQVPLYRGLAYESRLINPEAGNIVQEVDPVVKHQKQEEFLRRQEAEVLAMQKSIEELQQQIIDQIDAEHKREQKKVSEKKENHLQNVQKVDALIQDQKSIQSNYSPIQVLPNEQRDEVLSVVENTQFATVSPILSQVHPFQDQIIADSVASAEHDKQTDIANNIQNSVVQSEGNNKIVEREFTGNVEIPTHLTVKSQNLAGLLMLHNRANIQTQENPTARGTIALQNSPNVHLDYPHYGKEIVDLVPPSVVTDQDSPESVLLEPHPVEHESKLLPVSPSPTLFPVKIDSPMIIENPTKVLEQEKPIVMKQPMEYTKVVEVEKPVPVLQPYPIEVTKFVHVDRPVSIPTPFPVSHTVPVPVAIPHPVEVLVPHLIPVPEIMPITLKEYYPVFIYKKQKESGSKSTIKQQSIPKSVHSLVNQSPTVTDLHIPGSSFGANANIDSSRPHSYESDETRKPHLQPVTVIVKQNPELDQFFRSNDHGIKQGIDWDVFMAKYGSDLQFSDESLRDTFKNMYKTGISITHPLQGDSFGKDHRGHDRKKNVLRNLRIEYGFKPPLRPSLQITEEVKPSVFGPSIKSDK